MGCRGRCWWVKGLLSVEKELKVVKQPRLDNKKATTSPATKPVRRRPEASPLRRRNALATVPEKSTNVQVPAGKSAKKNSTTKRQTKRKATPSTRKARKAKTSSIYPSTVVFKYPEDGPNIEFMRDFIGVYRYDITIVRNLIIIIIIDASILVDNLFVPAQNVWQEGSDAEMEVGQLRGVLIPNTPPHESTLENRRKVWCVAVVLIQP